MTAPPLSGRTRDVWLALRDAGARTPSEIARLVGGDGGGPQMGPALFLLVQRGWAVRMGGRYCNARTAGHMARAAARG